MTISIVTLASALAAKVQMLAIQKFGGEEFYAKADQMSFVQKFLLSLPLRARKDCTHALMSEMVTKMAISQFIMSAVLWELNQACLEDGSELAPYANTEDFDEKFPDNVRSQIVKNIFDKLVKADENE